MLLKWLSVAWLQKSYVINEPLVILNSYLLKALEESRIRWNQLGKMKLITYFFIKRQASFEEATDKDIKEDAAAKGTRQKAERGRPEETRGRGGEKKERRRNKKN